MIKKKYFDQWMWVILVTGLGFFSDMFDAFSYGVIRVPSLTELGFSGDELTKAGLTLLNYQVFGSLVGGLFWGLVGDKIGRKKALFGSILVDSIAMILNSYVHHIEVYNIVRFFIGFGFAGEVGLGATMVAEALPKAKRTYALATFTFFGLMGVVAACLLAEVVHWRNLTMIGGIVGLLLLFLRGILMESPLFASLKQQRSFLAPLKQVFSSARLFGRYLACIFILAPNFFVTGFLLILSPELAKYFGFQDPIKPSYMLAIYFTVSVIGDFAGAFLSHRLKLRRQALIVFLLGNLAISAIYLYIPQNVSFMYWMAASLGLFNLWALSSVVAVEQFPTHLRATVSTSVVNFARCMQIPMNLAFWALKDQGIIFAVSIVGATIIALGLISAFWMRETYHVELDKVEI